MCLVMYNVIDSFLFLFFRDVFVCVTCVVVYSMFLYIFCSSLFCGKFVFRERQHKIKSHIEQ